MPGCKKRHSSTALSPSLSLSVTGKSLASATTDKNLDGLSGFHF